MTTVASPSVHSRHAIPRTVVGRVAAVAVLTIAVTVALLVLLLPGSSPAKATPSVAPQPAGIAAHACPPAPGTRFC
jgi:hypothetical protein